MQNRQPIGRTKGPGETPHEYYLVTADPQQEVKYGEFVYYSATVDGQRRDILARVKERVPLRAYPDTFMQDPGIPPEDVAALLGYDQGAQDLFQITAVILGYYDPVMGFVNPRVPPRAGMPIYVADDEMLSEVLCRIRPETVGAVRIGSLLSRPADAVPVVLDARGFTSTHLAIIASTGAGKSYLAGVILEELMQPHNRASVLVIDPHAEYDTLDEIQGHPDFERSGYRPRVKIIRPDDIKVRVSTLTLGDLRYLLYDLTERMHYLLGRAYGRLRSEKGDKWSRGDLKTILRQGDRDAPVTDPEEDEEIDSSVQGLLWRIDRTFRQGKIFDDNVDLALDELFCPGQCTVLQLNEVPLREQCVIVATLLRRLYQARMDTARGRAQAGERNYLPYPAFVLIEEAHTYAPASADLITTDILKQILSEGRKFGISVGLISQRPGKLDGDVLSQCMTQCIMRVVNPVDQTRIRESVESVGHDLLGELPALSKGQVIVAGASVNTPILTQVRRRLTTHGAEDPDAPQQWQSYWSETETDRRARDEAAPADDFLWGGDDDYMYERRGR